MYEKITIFLIAYASSTIRKDHVVLCKRNIFMDDRKKC